MCVVYFSKRDYRQAMQSPSDAHRVHAMCRRLLGVPPLWPIRNKPGCCYYGHWYGAHYWAGCAMTCRTVLNAEDESSRQRMLEENLIRYKRFFARELTDCDGRTDPPIPRAYERLWDLAVQRMSALLPEALELSTSVLW